MSSLFLPLCVISVVTLVLIGSCTAEFPRICGNRYYESKCDNYKKSKGCNVPFMKTNCRFACDQCEPGDVMPAKTTNSCFDNWKSWACTAKGDTIGCGTAVMVKNCQRSCNLCEGQQTKVIVVTPAPAVVEGTTGAYAE